MESSPAVAHAGPSPSHPGFFQLALGMLVAPGEACDLLLRRRRSALKPLAVLMIGFSVLWAYYYFRVDFPWMVDRMIDGAMSRSSAAGNREVMAAKLVTKEAPNLFSWVALSIWAAVPTVLSILLSGFHVLTNDVRNLMPADIGVASVNNLFLDLPDSNPWAAMANSFDVLLVWSFFIMGFGFSRWTGAGLALGQFVAFLPFAVLYGIWALFVVF